MNIFKKVALLIGNLMPKDIIVNKDVTPQSIEFNDEVMKREKMLQKREVVREKYLQFQAGGMFYGIDNKDALKVISELSDNEEDEIEINKIINDAKGETAFDKMGNDPDTEKDKELDEEYKNIIERLKNKNKKDEKTK